MNAPIIPIWKKAPFFRLLLPLIVGIILQWYFQFSIQIILLAAIGFFISFFLFRFLPLAVRFKIQAIQGMILQFGLISFGLLITSKNDIRNQKNWFGNFYTDSSYIIMKINEPPIEKAKSFKAEVLVEAVINKNGATSCEGKVLIYLSKDSAANTLNYGDKIIIHKSLQKIKNSGNPGAFNYERYASFQNIFYNVFLKKEDYIVLKEKDTNGFNAFIFKTKKSILQILKNNIKEKDELGVAEALLIGYKEDLDKDLVQAYSNTGVVHIIAISGLHLGLIYIMLLWLFNKIPFVKKTKIIKVVFILAFLWLFSLLTGASASVLRSAVMFTCIIIGENFAKKSSIYNSLAASAFLLLSYNPYFLWDVGFQLSYLAVIGIVVLQNPVYKFFYIKNKWLDKIWQLVAVSLAAQVFTFPVCIYYFHQFPNLFLITNLIAVPLSSIILFVEIFLICFSWVPFVGFYIGKLTGWLIELMNTTILFINKLPYALWDKIPATVYSTWLMYGLIIGICVWLMNANKKYFLISLGCLTCFLLLNAFENWTIRNQQKIIVYNVPKYQAIDIINGDSYKFIGDSILLKDGLLQNFHLKPARINLQLNQRVQRFNNIFESKNFIQVADKKLFILGQTIIFDPMPQKIGIDYLVISKNPKMHIQDLLTVFNCKLFVFDASNSLWKIEQWKRECEELHLPYYIVSEKGAFIISL